MIRAIGTVLLSAALLLFLSGWSMAAKAEHPSKTEHPTAEKPKVEKPKAEKPKVEKPKVEPPKAEHPKAEHPKPPK